MPDCQFCAEMPAVVNQRWCEPCWAEICEAGKRVEELRAFYRRVEGLASRNSADRYAGAGGLKTRLIGLFARYRAHLAAITTRKITTVKPWERKTK